jgi:hypothetical protein
MYGGLDCPVYFDDVKNGEGWRIQVTTKHLSLRDMKLCASIAVLIGIL